MTNLKGSEKQIAWAAEILNKVNPLIDWILNNMPDGTPAENIAKFNDMRDRINNAQASKVIDCYKDFAATGNIQKDAYTACKRYMAYQKVSPAQDQF